MSKILKQKTALKPEKRFELLFGPYDPPRTKRGAYLTCQWRGKVKVGSYSEGDIPWPIKCALLKCMLEFPRLSRAFRCAFRPLPGQNSSALFVSPNLKNGKPAKAAPPRPWTPEEDALLGKYPDREVAARVGRALSTVQIRRFTKGILAFEPLRQPWTAEEDKLLGTMPDEDVAQALSRPVRAVRRPRNFLHIPNPAPKRRTWLPEEIKLLGRKPDAEIARLLGCPTRSVTVKRCNLGIRAWIDPKMAQSS